MTITCQFLSTPSARRATVIAPNIDADVQISIHALREEGDMRVLHQPPASSISIHALREEGDAQHLHIHPPRSRISIHALREEGDTRR